MEEEHVEPAILVARHEHPHTITPQFKVHSLIFDIAYAVQPEVSFALAKQHRPDSNASVGGVGVGHGEVNLSHVVHEASH